MNTTRDRLLAAGLEMMLERGYHDTGIRDLLDATGVPRGSFYHHFDGKRDFALRVIDRYTDRVDEHMNAALGDTERPPLDRVRRFFELTRSAYEAEGFLGCLMGTLGQELSATDQVFRRKLEGCLSALADRIAGCIEEARTRGDVSHDVDPHALANILIDSWEGAALRTRMRRDPAPLDSILRFYFDAVARPATSTGSAA